MDDEFVKMRGLIKLVEYTDYSEPEFIEEFEETPSQDNSALIEKLNDLVFKLRSHYETEDSDKSLGIELGMSMAAEMLEHVINNFGE
jgi:hypothetical protein